MILFRYIFTHNDIQSDRYELQLLSEDWSDSILLDVVNNIKQIDCNDDVATSDVNWYDTVNLSSVEFADHTIKEGISASNLLLHYYPIVMFSLLLLLERITAVK